MANSARGFFGPKGIPASEIAALEAAFKSASHNSKLAAELVKQGNPTGYQSPSTVAEDYKTFLTVAKKVTPYLGPIKNKLEFRRLRGHISGVDWTHLLGEA